MKMKKFVAESMPAALQKIRTQLGDDAVIVNSKVVYTGGFLGMFKKRQLEIVAAVDEHGAPSPQKVAYEHSPEKKEIAPASPSLEPLLQEVKQLREQMSRKQQTESVNNGLDSTLFPEEVQPICRNLLQVGVRPSTVKLWTEQVTKRLYKDDALQVENAFSQEMQNAWSSLTFGPTLYEKKYINVVGPTGVGKTTTLAKLAADSILQHGKRAAFITTDTYRIAAIDQLQTYAKIVGAPLEVCYNVQDFRKAKERFCDYDVVFVDTAGRNFRNETYVQDLEKVIDFTNEVETFLVLALTSKEEDMRAIIDKFRHIDIHRFIFTKLDETATYGTMVSIVEEYEKGVAYVTNGQNVPDDLLPISKDAFAKLLLNDGCDQHG